MHLTSTEKDVLPYTILEEIYFAEIRDGSTLLVNEYLTDALTEHPVDLWRTAYSQTAEAQTWPDQDIGYDRVIIRLPKSHTLFDFFLHAAGSVLAPDGEIVIYGTNDEGIKGAQKKLASFFGSCDVLGYKKRVRVLSSKPTPSFIAHKRSLKDFKETVDITYEPPAALLHGTPLHFSLAHYPGMFNKGRLDDGSRLLLDEVLPLLREKQNVLDYGTGTGALTYVVGSCIEGLSCDLLDYDAVSLAAAKKNLTESNFTKTFHLGDSLDSCGDTSYDFIISNPPIHTAKKEQFETLERLILDAPQYLVDGGSLVLVAQSRINVEEQFSQSFSTWAKLAETTRFTVWQGTK